jgi:hypothetical protein
MRCAAPNIVNIGPPERVWAEEFLHCGHTLMVITAAMVTGCVSYWKGLKLKVKHTWAWRRIFMVRGCVTCEVRAEAEETTRHGSYNAVCSLLGRKWVRRTGDGPIAWGNDSAWIIQCSACSLWGKKWVRRNSCWSDGIIHPLIIFVRR